MSREAKKRPGAIKGARARHLRRQAITDGLAAIRRGEEAIVDMEGSRVKLLPLSRQAEMALIRVGGKIRICWIGCKDGAMMASGVFDRSVCCYYYHARHLLAGVEVITWPEAERAKGATDVNVHR